MRTVVGTQLSNHKQIDRCNPFHMIADEGLPGLQWPIARGTMQIETVDWATWMPSLSNSPWILVAPQNGFSRLILRIRSRTSLAIRGGPGERDFHRQ